MKKMFLIAVLMTTAMLAFADSPLTSCEFYSRYTTVPMVKTAAKATSITQPIMNYLANTANPIAARVAVVNALGWLSNAVLYRHEACAFLGGPQQPRQAD